MLLSIFNISCLAQGSFKYVGLNVVQNETEVQVDQQNYVQNLKPIFLSADRRMHRDDKLTLKGVTTIGLYTDLT